MRKAAYCLLFLIAFRSYASPHSSSYIDVPFTAINSPYKDNIKSLSIGEKIADGSFSEVYEGFIEFSNNKTIKMVLKIFKEETDDYEIVIKNEISILSYLQNKEYKFLPNLFGIFNLHGSNQFSERIALIMSHGGVKLDFKNDPNLAGIFKELISKVNELHKLGIVHRDLKPDNILGEEGNVVLIDFGLSSHFVNTHEPLGSGTIHFFCHPNDYLRGDKSEDVFALGVTLWYLKHGSYPQVTLNNGKEFKSYYQYVAYQLTRFANDYKTKKHLLSPKDSIDYTIIDMINPLAHDRPSLDDVLRSLEK